MAYLSLNFVVPDDIDSPDSIEVVAVEGNRFFLRLTYVDGFKYVYPPSMHVFYENNIGVLRNNLTIICRTLFRENERLKDETKEKKARLQSKQKEFPRGCRNKKA